MRALDCLRTLYVLTARQARLLLVAWLTWCKSLIGARLLSSRSSPGSPSSPKCACNPASLAPLSGRLAGRPAGLQANWAN